MSTEKAVSHCQQDETASPEVKAAGRFFFFCQATPSSSPSPNNGHCPSRSLTAAPHAGTTSHPGPRAAWPPLVTRPGLLPAGKGWSADTNPRRIRVCHGLREPFLTEQPLGRSCFLFPQGEEGAPAPPGPSVPFAGAVGRTEPSRRAAQQWGLGARRAGILFCADLG